jgi:alcohol dehydrogenase class IV
MKYLPLSVSNGSDLLARGQMQIAALLAGWAFSNALLGLVHAMAHALGAVCRTPHGLANGILLPHVMAFNREEIPDLMADLAMAMGAATKDMPVDKAGKAAVKAVEDLIQTIGLPGCLGEVGVTEDQLGLCVERAMSDGSIIYNPKMIMEPQEVMDVYKKAFG